MVPQPIKKFIDLLSKLPSIGPRQATRLAFYIVNSGKGNIAEFTEAFNGLAKIKICSGCFFIHQKDGGECGICADPKRRSDIIAVVEKETDLLSLEKARKFEGKYLVIGDMKKSGTLDVAQKLKLQNLKSRLIKLPAGIAEEIIIATNPTTYGDVSAAAISQELSGAAKIITRLGRGLPTGGEIEFADEETLGQALNNRS